MIPVKWLTMVFEVSVLLMLIVLVWVIIFRLILHLTGTVQKTGFAGPTNER